MTDKTSLEKLQARIQRVIEADTDDFFKLAEVLERNPLTDLAGANLSNADLSGANLSGADLSNADLSGANLSNANLSNANLSNANLSGANLSGADLSGASVKGTQFGDNLELFRDIKVEVNKPEATFKNSRSSTSPVPAPTQLINLSQWLQNTVQAGWQTVEDVLGSEKANLVFALRGIARSKGIIRAELVHLGMPQIGRELALVVAVMPKATQEIGINLQLHPSDSTTLPPGLKCIVFDTSEKILLEVESKDTDNQIQLHISGRPEEQFTLRIILNEASITKYFVI